MPQVYPHPEGNTEMAAEYRQAMTNLEGSNRILDYLSFEGWASAHFSVKVLQTMTTFTRASFLKAVDERKMVKMGDQLAGPFASDCTGTKETINKARSSLCYCNQGFRFVELTEVSHTTLPTPPPPYISYALVQATVGVGTVLIWDLILIRYQTQCSHIRHGFCDRFASHIESRTHLLSVFAT